ncbi:MAG: hypothetical protein ACRDQZ_05160 [Mycobacteriales bacterium]
MIKTLEDELDLGLKKAKALAEGGGVVAGGVTLDRGDQLVERLSRAGATAQRVDAGTVHLPPKSTITLRSSTIMGVLFAVRPPLWPTATTAAADLPTA